jgi:hypothetical protein
MISSLKGYPCSSHINFLLKKYQNVKHRHLPLKHRHLPLKLGIDRIVGLTTKGNSPSIKVLQKLGMEYEKTVKMSDDDPGTVVYSKLVEHVII